MIVGSVVRDAQPETGQGRRGRPFDPMGRFDGSAGLYPRGRPDDVRDQLVGRRSAVEKVPEERDQRITDRAYQIQQCLPATSHDSGRVDRITYYEEADDHDDEDDKHRYAPAVHEINPPR